MVKYICETCKLAFDKKCRYDKHLERKTNCKILKYKPEKKVHNCGFCEKEFSRADSLRRHISMCPMINLTKNNTNIKGNENFHIHGNNNGDIDNSTTITNNNNNNNISFNIYPCGKDGIDCLSLDEKIQVLVSKIGIIIELIKLVNFDPNKPEHHNMYMDDVKSGYLHAFSGEKWEIKRSKGFIYNLIDTKKEDIKKILDEMKIFLYENDIQKIENEINKIRIEDPKLMKILISYIKATMCENKDIVKKSKDIYEKIANNYGNLDDDNNVPEYGIIHNTKVKMDLYKLKNEIQILKDEIEYLLSLPIIIEKMDHIELLKIQQMAKNTYNKHSLKTILTCISGIFMGKNINKKFIEQKINNDNKIYKWSSDHTTI